MRKRHPLLLYRRLAAYYRGPLLLLLLVSVGLLAWDPPELQELRSVLGVTLVLSAALLLLTFLMSTLHVQLPLYRLRVPYESIVETRSVTIRQLFPPSKQPFSSRGFLAPLWQLTAVVVDLEWLPQPRWRLRLWMDGRMILKKGLVLLVKDHRALRRQIDEAVVRWRVSDRDAERELL
jgi:hypothetical protein